MTFAKDSLKYIVTGMILILILSSCERPLQTDESIESEEATSEIEATKAVEEGEVAEETVTEIQSAEEVAEVMEEQATDLAELAEEAITEAETAQSSENEEEITSEETPTAESEAEATIAPTETPVFEQAVEEEATEEAAEEEMAEVEEEAETGEAAEGETSEAEAEGELTAQAEGSSQALPATHTVLPSDNLYRIGLQYGISWVAIAEHNNLFFPYTIHAGQVLQLPGGGETEASEPAAESTETATNYLDYSVQFGDTLANISQQFGVTREVIIEVNGIVNPNLIYAGQVLKIPTTSPEGQASVTHLVQWGETLTLISLQYGVPWLSIAEANNISAPYVVYAGQTLVIPGG
jgi:LysM repeat protein